MSNSAIIHTVSTTLKNLLQNELNKPIANSVTVTVTSPEVQVTDDFIGIRVNLFLYKVAEDAYLKNQEIPGVGNPGNYDHPPLSLDLHYLLTVINSAKEEDELPAHRVLGRAMRIMYDNAVITEKRIRDLNPTITDPEYLQVYENLKMVLDPINLEDLMKIWTALTKPYKLSVAYNVSAVQIEKDEEKPSISRPLGEGPLIEAKVYAIPSTIPRIENIRIYHGAKAANQKELEAPYANVGDTLIISGRNFTGDIRVILGTVDATDQINYIRDDSRIELTVPNRAELQPGSQTVRLAFDVMMGKSHAEQKHTISNSNQSIFLLAPRIDSFELNSNLPLPTLVISGSRLFNPEMECMTMIGDMVIHSSDYILDNSTNPEPSDSIAIPQTLVPGLVVGTTYTVRVRVNGVENIDVEKTLVPSP
jgi:hypothetical protein